MTFLYCLLVGYGIGSLFRIERMMRCLLLICALAFLLPGFFSDRVFGPFDIVSSNPPLLDQFPEGVNVKNPALNDIPLQLAPWKYLSRKYIVDGFLPFYNPYTGCGQSLWANGQAAPFSPFLLLTLPLPFQNSFVAEAFFKIILAMFGMYLLAYALFRSREGALFAALAYSLGGSIQGWLLWNQAAVLAFYPFLLLATLHLFKSKHLRFPPLYLVLVTCAMILAGHPETLLFSMMSTTLFGLTLAWDSKSLSRLALFVAAIGTGWLMTAPYILPVILQIPKSYKHLEMSMVAEKTPFRLWWAVPILMPRAFGFPTGLEYWGFSVFDRVVEGSVGILTLPLALIHLMRKTRDSIIITFLVLQGGIAFMMLIDLGFVSRALFIVPVFKLAALRYAGGVFALSIALLAASGIQKWLEGNEDVQRRLRLATMGFIALILILLPWCYRLSKDIQRDILTFPDRLLDFQLAWITTLMVLVVLMVIILKRGLTPRVACGIAILNGLLLFQSFFCFIPSVSSSLFYPDFESRSIIQNLSKDHRLIGAPGVFFPNASIIYELYDVRTHDPMENADYVSTLLKHEILREGYHKNLKSIQLKRPELFRWLSVSTIIAPHFYRLPPPYELKWTTPTTRCYFLPDSPPLFYFPEKVHFQELKEDSSDGDMLFADKHSAVFHNRESDLSAGEGRVLSWKLKKGNRFDIKVEVQQEGVLVAQWCHLPGFSARLDGKPTAIIPMNTIFMGVVVPKGYHKIELLYHPPGFRLGLLLMLLAMVTIVVWIVFGDRFRTA